MQVPFSKLSGCGNDFILIDNSGQKFSVSPDLFSRICRRQSGIGADGVIWVEESTSHSARIRIFNADGSEAEACGNAFRCVFAYVKGKNPAPSGTYNIQTPFTSATASWEHQLIRLELQDPSEICWNIPLQVDESTFNGHLLNTGVPHLVLFIDDLDSLDLLAVGSALRDDPRFAPAGVNVNFATRQNSQLTYRTYERGVGLTNACGTGAVAVALASHHLHCTPTPASPKTYSGDTLRVDFSLNALNQYHQIFLTGPAELVYEGNIHIGNEIYG